MLPCWSGRNTTATRQALTIAAFRVAGSAGWLARAVAGASFEGGDLEAVVDVLAERRPPWLDKLPAAFIRSNTFFPWWRLVRELVRRELIARPEDPTYTLAAAHSATDTYRPPHSPSAVLEDDPGFIDDIVWPWFRTEEAGRRLTTHDGYAARWVAPQAGTWAEALVGAAADGRIDRGRLLDATLHTLHTDFRDADLTWFADLHGRLAPSDDELAARGARYLGLLTVGYGRAVAIALAAAVRLHTVGRLDLPALLDAVPVVLVRKEKKAPLAALRLLGQLVRQPEHRDAVAACAAHAFEHRDPGVQIVAWDLIEPVLADLSPATLARIVETAEVAAPSVASRLDALRVATTAPDEPADPPAERPEPPARSYRMSPFPAPIDDVEELAGELAALLHGDVSAIALERVLAGAARLSTRPADELRLWFAPLAARHGCQQLLAEDQVWRVPAGRSPPYELEFWLAELVSVLADADQDIPGWLPGDPAETTRQLDHFALGPAPHGLLVARIHELATRIRWRQARPLLATPTGLDGSIDEQTYRDRLAALTAAGHEPWPADAAQARLRVRGPVRVVATPYLGETIWSEWDRMLDRPPRPCQLAELTVTATDPADAELLTAAAGRYAEGRAAVESAFAGSLDYNRRDFSQDEPLWAWLTPAEPDLVLARWLPLFNQEAAGRSASGPGVMPALEWLALTDRYDAVLVPPCLALALGAGRVDTRLLAAEVVATAIGDGRLAPDHLAAAMWELASAGLVKLSRIADALRLVSAADGHAAWRLLGDLLPLLLADRPRDTATLFTIACDLAASTAAAEPPDGVRALAAERGTTRLHTEARRLATICAT